MVETAESKLPEVLTTKEVAALLRVCTKTIYTMIERKILPARKVGNGKRDYRFSRDHVLEWLRSTQSFAQKR
jgi:excisionase family DNA binding protein